MKAFKSHLVYLTTLRKCTHNTEKLFEIKNMAEIKMEVLRSRIKMTRKLISYYRGKV